MKIFYFNGIRMLTVAIFAIFSLNAFSQVVVITNADAGPGSLRDAITIANANPGSTITFNMPGSTVIGLASPLPPITEQVTIQGYSQPGSAVGPIGARTILVEINCNQVFGNGLEIQADGVVISGIALYNSLQTGIMVQNSTVGITTFRIWGCHIGTDGTGTASGIGNTLDGIHVGDGLIDCTGITIGSDADNLPPAGPFDGFDADEGNVIVGNGIGPTPFSGIALQLTNTSRIAGNYIGIAADGLQANGNGLAGIGLTDACAGVVIGVDENFSVDASQKNYVGNNGAGIVIFGDSHDNFVSGNFVGLTPTGTPAPHTTSIPTPGGPGPGILVWGSSTNTIGTNANGISDALEGNTVGFNGVGILILANDFGTPFPANPFSATFNKVMGNYVGTDASGTSVFPNVVYGIAVRADATLDASFNTIGADDLDPAFSVVEGNIVNNSGKGGVAVGLGPGATTATAFLNRISYNSFENNSLDPGPVQGPGLSIANSFTFLPTPNDCGDGDFGGNDLLNRPVIESAVFDATNLIIKGWAEPFSTLELYTTSGSKTFDTVIYAVRPSLPFGELKSPLLLLTESNNSITNGFVDEDNTTSLYPSDGTGVTCTENRFQFTIPLASLPGTFIQGGNVAMIAFDQSSDVSNTSEASFISLTTLPVSLTDFTGKLVDGKSQLKWITASEQNSHHFDVERSADGTHYGAIGTLTAKGNSTLSSTYNFTDAAPVKGLNYYRLKQVDKDGKYVYSGVVVIRNNGAFVKTQIIPNPAHNIATISIMLSQKEDLQVRLFDNAGKLTRTYKFNGNSGENQFPLSDLSTLPTGVYTVDIRGTQTSIQQKLVKY